MNMGIAGRGIYCGFIYPVLVYVSEYVPWIKYVIYPCDGYAPD